MKTIHHYGLMLLFAMLLTNSLLAQEIYPGKTKQVEKDISYEMPFESRFMELGQDTVHYVESGQGEAVVMLHGLPANLYVWRNVISNVDDNKQVIALDFLGFGQSSFPKDSITSIEVQYKMFTDFVEAKNLKNITLFIQDIGSLVGMLYAIREPQNVKGIVLFEAPFMPAEVMYDQLPFSFRAFMKLTRTQKRNEKWMVKRNFAGKKLAVKFFTGRKLPKETYPYYNQAWDEKRRRYAITNGPDPAVLSYSKGRDESEFKSMLEVISKGMAETEIPILYMYAKKGLVNQKAAVKYAMEHFKNAEFVYLGKGKHFLTEAHPRQMSEKFNEWFLQLR
jgi:haloalkane dehalogenase